MIPWNFLRKKNTLFYKWEQLQARVIYWLLHLLHQYYLHKSISVSPNLNCTVLCIMSVIDRLHLIQLCLRCTEWLSRWPKRSSLSSLVNAFDRESFRHQLQDKSTLQVIYLSQVLHIVVAYLYTVKLNAYRLCLSLIVHQEKREIWTRMRLANFSKQHGWIFWDIYLKFNSVRLIFFYDL